MPVITDNNLIPFLQESPEQVAAGDLPPFIKDVVRLEVHPSQDPDVRAKGFTNLYIVYSTRFSDALPKEPKDASKEQKAEIKQIIAACKEPAILRMERVMETMGLATQRKTYNLRDRDIVANLYVQNAPELLPTVRRINTWLEEERCKASPSVLHAERFVQHANYLEGSFGSPSLRVNQRG